MSNESVCRYWATKGKCFYGDNCRFTHDPSATTTATTTAAAAAAASPASSSQVDESANPTIALRELVTASEQQKLPQRAIPEFIPASASATAPAASHHAPSSAYHAAGLSHMPQHMNRQMGGQMPVLPTDVLHRQHHHQSQPQPQPSLYPIQRSLPSFFMSEHLREQLYRENQLRTTRLQPEDPSYGDVPLTICKDAYHSLWPIPFDSQNRSSTFRSKMFKVTSSQDGRAYALRRIMGCRVTAKDAKQQLEAWSAIAGADQHPHIVSVRHVFSSNEFEDGGSLCLVADYFPDAVTVESRHLATPDSKAISEETIWSYICQLVSALATIHSSGLACRVVVPKRILITERNRIRLNWCGLGQVLGAQPQAPTQQLQYDDLVALGRLALTLACQRRDVYKNVKAALKVVEARYSPDLRDLISLLLSKPDGRVPTIFNIASLISHRLLGDLQKVYTHADALRSELSKEVQNGRLFRLLVKMGFMNERPSLGNDKNWAENEERYIIKLFRDFVFHTVHEDGSPHVNFAHVVQCLNKLDAGSTEKTLLVSRNEDSMLVVRYADVKHCIDQAFQQLVEAGKRKA